MADSARSADDWWHTLTAERRDQIHRWITHRKPGDNDHPLTPGQLELPTVQEEPAPWYQSSSAPTPSAQP